jgi:hypothetical protein
MNFQWKNCLVFNNFSTVDWNIMKPTWCTLIHQGLSNGTKSIARGILVSIWQTNKTYKQTNNLLLLIDDVLYHKFKVAIVQDKKVRWRSKRKTLTFHINDAPYFNFKSNNSNKKISNEIPKKWNIEFTLTYNEHSSQCGNQINLLKKAFCFLHWDLSQTIVHTWYIWKALDE